MMLEKNYVLPILFQKVKPLEHNSLLADWPTKFDECAAQGTNFAEGQTFSF